MTHPGTTEIHRPARVQPAPVEPGVVAIAAPPALPDPVGNVVWQVIAPVLGSVGMLGFAVVLREPRYLIMAGVLAGVMLLSGIISRVIQTRGDRKRRAVTATRYREHLTKSQALLETAADGQRSIIQHNHPSPAGLLDICAAKTRVWERRPDHRDFLTVRLGVGDGRPEIRPKLEMPGDPLAEFEPDLLATAQLTERTAEVVADLPICIDLADVGCLAIVGDSDEGRKVGASIVSQLATLCSPVDLQIAGLVPTVEWAWLKWLPHARPQSGHQTWLADNAPDFATVLERVTGQRLADFESSQTGLTKPSPTFTRALVLVDGFVPDSGVGQLETFHTAISHASDFGVVFVVLVEDPDHIPAHTDATITIAGDTTLSYSPIDDPSGISGIQPDQTDRETFDRLARLLAPLRPREGKSPKTHRNTGLLALLKADDAGLQGGHRTPIGVDTDGQTLTLDIREASAGGMGPHGILIGATGSGKSELLRTIVLGLAASNHQDSLGFVLTDFKGGATFAGLERLPHVAGMITNLESDPSLMDRMQDSLFGELERRQRFLRSAGFDRADEYRRHRNETQTMGSEPLPALLVIVDEFGELLANRPDFVDLFTTIGRTGRSLGIHLLLASQRLDEGRIRRVESHLRYRICLRTFSAEESVTVIGSRASFELPSIPGLGHLKVDSDLIGFRAAMVSQAVNAGEAQAGVSRFQLHGIDMVIPPDERRVNRPTETDLILDRLEDPSGKTRAVWHDPLASQVAFEPEPADWLKVRIGTTDLPRQQKQEPAILDFSGAGGSLAIVGGPRSGKSTALRTLVGSLAAVHRPDEVAIYVIDLGGGSLHQLEALPHVGSVYGRSHRAEITRLVHQIQDLITARVDLFREAGFVAMSDFHAARRTGSVTCDHGEVFMVIDNWGFFAQDFAVELGDAMTEIVTGGLHYGVHVVLTANRWLDIRTSLRDNIGGRFELRLSDPIESEVDRVAARQVQADTPGRGIDQLGRLTQVFAPPTDVAVLSARWDGAPAAPAVRVLPERVSETDITAIGPDYLGIEEQTLGGWKPDLFSANPHLLVTGDGEAGKTTTLRGIIRTIRSTDDSIQIGVVDYRGQLTSELLPGSRFGVATTAQQAAALAERIHDDIVDRRANTGHHVLLVVDDYNLVAGQHTNPLGCLTDLIPRAGDLRLHLVLTTRVTGLSRTSFDPLFQMVKETAAPWLVLSGDPGEGVIAANVRATDGPPGRGVYVNRSRTTPVQIAQFAPHVTAPSLTEEMN